MNKLYDTSAYKWSVVYLLLLVYILSYFDRYILSLVIEPLKESMDLNDFQVGLLLGPAFSMFHVIVSIPLGWYADKTSRKWIMIAGVVFWCTMTAAGGFVHTFLPLLILRLGLGLGEAVVNPCSISMISDYFDRAKRSRPISVYMAGTYLGAGLAFMIGGHLVAWLGNFDELVFFGIGPFESWQAAFFLVGLPGFFFALLLLTVKEPERTEKLSDALGGDTPKVNAFSYILKRWKAFGVLFIGSGCNYAMSILTLWNIPLFQRVWGWDVAAVGSITGLFYFISGPIGTVIAVWASRRLGGKTNQGAIRTLLLGLLITVPTCFLYPIMPTAELAVVIMAIAFIGKAIATASGPASLALITPGEMRSQAIAIFTTVITILGPLFTPPLVGLVIDATGNPNTIGIVLSGFVISVGIPSILVLTFGMKHYREALTDMEDIAAASEKTAAEPAPH